VLQASASVYATRRGGRANVRFAYSPRLRYYLSGTQNSRVDHRLNANGRVELIENYFFLSANASATQRLINPQDNVGFDNISNPDAFTQTWAFSVVPDIRFPIRGGDFATVRVRPGVNYTVTGNSASGGGRVNTGGRTTRVDIRSGRFFTRFRWNLNYRNDIWDVNSDDGFGRADGTLRYDFNRQYAVSLTLGYDEGRYRTNQDSSGFRWRSTVYWNPTIRTSLSLGVGEAFYGDDWELRFRHRHKQTIFDASYYVNVEDARQSILDQEVIPLVDEFGNEIENPFTGEPILIVVGTPALIEDVYVQQTFRAGMSTRRGRTNGNLQLRYYDRNYQTLELDTQDATLDFNLGRRLTPRTSGNLNVRYWKHTEEATDANDYDQYSARLSLSYRISQKITSSIGYRYSTRNSAVSDDNFDEGRVDWNLRVNL